MYLVSPEYVPHQPPPAPPTPSPHQPMAAMAKARTKNSKQRRRRETKTKQHPYDKSVKLKCKIQEADIARKTYGSTSAGQAMPLPATPDVQTGLKEEVSDTASPSLPFLSRAHESVFASPIK